MQLVFITNNLLYSQYNTFILDTKELSILFIQNNQKKTGNEFYKYSLPFNYQHRRFKYYLTKYI